MADDRQGGRSADAALRRRRPRLGHAGGERRVLRRCEAPVEPARARAPDPERGPDPGAARHPLQPPARAPDRSRRPHRRTRRLPLRHHRCLISSTDRDRCESGLAPEIRVQTHSHATQPECGVAISEDGTVTAGYPKIELHVHLEGAIRPKTLLAIARRNGIELPADSEDGIADLYRFRDFAHFVQVWILTTNVLRTAGDCRAIVVDYAAEAATHGAVYLEAIFSPIERVARGVEWAALFDGYCDGAAQAEEEHGVIVRLTPDLYRGADPDDAIEAARWSVRFRDRGVVGLGLGGLETACPADVSADAFAIARDGGLGAVPHAGESAGPDSIRATMSALGADRIRHGIRAVDDATLLAELADNRVVLDVCPTSNIRTRVITES